jgi:hypothetical protein
MGDTSIKHKISILHETFTGLECEQDSDLVMGGK